jgi:putative ABC transport system substrate-binding protein
MFGMRRREFITLLGGAAAAWPVGERMRRIAVLLPATTDDTQYQTWFGAFLQGLQQSGWTIGRNVQIDTRWATANADVVRRNAAELVALAPDSHIGHWRFHPGAVAKCNPHGADRVRGRR